MAGWCSENDLELNVSKPNGVEEVKTFKCLGTTISSDLKWDDNISSAIKKAHQRLFFLRQLKKFKVQSFYPDSVLPRCN